MREYCLCPTDRSAGARAILFFDCASERGERALDCELELASHLEWEFGCGRERLQDKLVRCLLQSFRCVLKGPADRFVCWKCELREWLKVRKFFGLGLGEARSRFDPDGQLVEER